MCNIKPISCDDIMVWPDGTWCYRSELDEYAHMSDDYITLPADTQEQQDFLAGVE